MVAHVCYRRIICVESGIRFPIGKKQLLEDMVARGNLQTVLRNVKRNVGAPGIDGMMVNELSEYLKRRWPEIRRQLITKTVC